MIRKRKALDKKGRPRCQEWVHPAEYWDFHGHQCERIARFDPKEDGAPDEPRPFQHCKPHSAQGRAERREKQDARYEKSYKNSAGYLLREERTRIGGFVRAIDALNKSMVDFVDLGLGPLHPSGVAALETLTRLAEEARPKGASS